jgi:hypothetical protein
MVCCISHNVADNGFPISVIVFSKSASKLLTKIDAQFLFHSHNLYPAGSSSPFLFSERQDDAFPDSTLLSHTREAEPTFSFRKRQLIKVEFTSIQWNFIRLIKKNGRAHTQFSDKISDDKFSFSDEQTIKDHIPVYGRG